MFSVQGGDIGDWILPHPKRAGEKTVQQREKRKENYQSRHFIRSWKELMQREGVIPYKVLYLLDRPLSLTKAASPMPLCKTYCN